MNLLQFSKIIIPCYVLMILGFSTVNDITYPLTSQTVLTNGKWWTFCIYQLNTTLLHSEYADENPVSNMCWITEPMKLFDTVEDGKLCGFNENVLRHLLTFYMNTPEERIDVVDMKPYLGESVKHLADIPDVDRSKDVVRTMFQIYYV